MRPPAGVDEAVGLFAYSGVGATLVRRLKYANHRDALEALGVDLAGLVGGLVAGRSLDAVCWVPTTRIRRRERGFDQAALLARVVAKALGDGVPALGVLERGAGRPQTGAGRRARLSGPTLHVRRPCPPVVLIVDDVRTTGASLGAAATALRAGGARFVVAATLAVTPG